MPAGAGLGVRWTIGDVSPRGREALRLSILGAQRVFGAGAAYAVCVNSLPVDAVREEVGATEVPVRWLHVDAELPSFLRPHVDPGMAEGVAWKFAPLRVRRPARAGARQVAALSRLAPPHVVSAADVTICSPFPPHVPVLGRCGAHFVGVNARRLPFEFYGRPATDVRAEHWDALRGEVRARVGAPDPCALAVSAPPAPPA